VPRGCWRTLTLLAALRCNCDRIDAPCVLDGLSFLAYLEQMLLPTLSVGDIVIMDNFGSHKWLNSAAARCRFAFGVIPSHSDC
jgi:hypothetical protein